MTVRWHTPRRHGLAAPAGTAAGVRTSAALQPQLLRRNDGRQLHPVNLPRACLASASLFKAPCCVEVAVHIITDAHKVPKLTIRCSMYCMARSISLAATGAVPHATHLPRCLLYASREEELQSTQMGGTSWHGHCSGQALAQASARLGRQPARRA